MTTIGISNISDAILKTRKQMFLNFCQTLENEGIRYVILSGYQGYPDKIDSDVDFMVSEADFAKLPKLFRDSKKNFDATLIQMLQHETTACYYIIANQFGPHIAYLHPDSASSYRRKGRLWLRSEAVLCTRRQTNAGFWVPAAAVEFEYYFVKRIDKRLVELRHVERLATLMTEDPAGCNAVIATHVPTAQIDSITKAIIARDVIWFTSQRDVLQATLASNLTKEPMPNRIVGRVNNVFRQIKRILQPTGLVVAVLGPDGSGKTTVIEHLEKELAPAFRQVKRFHLRPHFGREGKGGIVTNPHSSPPRSSLASFAKMILFAIDYWWGYTISVYPAKVRSTLVIFDRHFYDMIVDPTRYRLPQDFLPAKLFTKFIPKPDIWLVLDAPAALLVSRKGELDLVSAEVLTNRYRAMAMKLPNGNLVNTGGAINETYINAIAPVLTMLAKRSAKRLGAV